MSLRKTTLFIIGFCFSILVMVLFVTTRNITYSKVEAIEDKLIVSNLNRTVNAIEAMISDLDIMVSDWAFWDDTYLFLQGKKDDYISSNLPIETFINQHNNIIMLLNRKKELVWGKYLPVSGDKLLPLPPGALKEIISLIDNPTVSDNRKAFKGVLLLENRLYMSACQPVLTSSQQGPSAGWVIMARELELNTLRSLEKRTELNLNLFKVGDKNIPESISTMMRESTQPDINAASEDTDRLPGNLNYLKPSPMIEKNRSELICSGLIRDLKGRAVAVISVRTSREIFESGVSGSRMMLILITITGLSIGGTALFFLEKRVIKRIVTLNDQVKSITDLSHAHSVGIDGNDEIASLSRSIHEMLLKIEENESLLTQIFRSIPAGVVLTDEASGIVREISLSALRMVGKRREEVVGTISSQFLFPDPHEVVVKSTKIDDHNHDIVVKSIQTTLMSANGSEIPVIKSVVRIKWEGRPMLLEMFLDFTELHETQKALRDSEEKYKTLFMNTGNATILVKEDTTIQLANQEFMKLARVPGAEWVDGRPSIEFFHPEEVDRMMEFHRLRRSERRHAAPRQYETRFKDYHGKIRSVNMTVAMLPGTSMSVCSILDITEWKKAEQDLAKKAFFDQLTNLPNRQLFHNRLEHALEVARRNQTMVGVFLLDIDDFKNVNDSMGHHAGDTILQHIAIRLSNRIRKRDTLARLGGDEFTLIVQDLNEVGDLCKIADNIIDDFKIPFLINSVEFYLGVSIGISLFPNDGTDSEMLTKNADLAMYQSKQQGKNRYKIFTEELNNQAQRRVAIERDLRNAIATENFEVYYQPKIVIKSGAVYGMEALVRGKRADGGMLSPGEFIPFAEESGLVVPIDLIVMRKACIDTARWVKAGKKDLVVSVNISTRHFHRIDFVESVEEILRQTALPPTCLELEVTETALMKDITQAMASIKELNRLGVSFSLDDFGTGYSSIYYLSHLPFQTLKIDKSFIDHICDQEHSASELVKIIISLAGNMNMKVVAEGVEREEQLERLRTLGCDQAQGYLISKPLPADQFEAFLFSDLKSLI